MSDVRFPSRRRVVLLGLVTPLLAACAGSAGAGVASPSATGTNSVAQASTSTGGSLTASAGSSAAVAASGAKQNVALVFPGPGTLIFLPFEVALAQGFFGGQGLNATFTYSKGGPPAVTALLAGSTDFVGTTIDLALNSYKQHKTITMVTSLTRVPAFAVVSTNAAVTGLKDLAGKKVGISNVGAGDELVLQFLLKQQGVDPQSVQYAAIGPDEAKINALKAGQVDAAILQEPALSIVLKQGGKELANLYDRKQAQAAFGGGYQFTGLVTTPAAISAKVDLVQRMVNAVVQADRFIAANSGLDIAAKLPDQAIVGGDRAAFAKILDQYKQAIYSADGQIHADEVDTVAKVQAASGSLTGPKPDMTQFFTNTFVNAAPK